MLHHRGAADLAPRYGARLILPTSIVGLGCAAIARRAASDASCSEVRGFVTRLARALMTNDTFCLHQSTSIF
jgi:hypothetical protein